jgi:hypothetical protein
MSNGDPIIIKGGGSITILLSKDSFPPDSDNMHRHYSADRNIIEVTIKDDSTGDEKVIDIPASGEFTISIKHSRT